MKMSSLIVIVLTMAVAAILIAPFVHLEPTALRSVQAALAFFTALATALLLQSRCHLVVVDFAFTERLSLRSLSRDLVNLLCSRLC